ncbi:MAG TPA: hypothetical protein VLW50_08060 [Streptosporangiaceae bacterium]|nr:hypothetical protein [Streptosporangiaceae bacterium]
MPRRPSVETLERDAKCADLYCKGFSYRQIMPQVGLRSTRSVGEAIRRHAKTAASETLRSPEVMQMMLDRLQDYRRLAWRVASSRHYITSPSGKVVTGPDGTPLPDLLPILAAVDRLVKIDVEEYKLRGLYAPAQARIEVVTQDMIEAEIRRLEAEVALNPDHSGTT